VRKIRPWLASAQMRGLVTALGLILLTLGLLGAAPIVRDVVNESEGKCDYMPCVWPWTFPDLAGWGALAAVGAILLTWSLLRLGPRSRRHLGDSQREL
jgi:hypothetical protein